MNVRRLTALQLRRTHRYVGKACRRTAGAAEMGSHKTSTLQDIEAGRTTEVEWLVGAVSELGRLVEYQTPRIDTLYACLKLLEKTTCGS